MLTRYDATRSFFLQDLINRWHFKGAAALAAAARYLGTCPGSSRVPSWGFAWGDPPRQEAKHGARGRGHWCCGATVPSRLGCARRFVFWVASRVDMEEHARSVRVSAFSSRAHECLVLRLSTDSVFPTPKGIGEAWAAVGQNAARSISFLSICKNKCIVTEQLGAETTNLPHKSFLPYPWPGQAVINQHAPDNSPPCCRFRSHADLRKNKLIQYACAR